MKTDQLKFRIIPGIILSFVMVCFTACEDMFDLPSKNSYESDVVFSSKTRATAAVCGVYPVLKGTAMMTYFTPDNDETHSTNTSGERYGLSRYNFSATSAQMANPFNSRYDGVNRANECIAGLEEEGVMYSGSEEDQAFFKGLYGEALTLRALCYFDLVRFWGDVPFKTKPTRAGDNFHLPRTSRDIIYDQLIEDLQLAETIVPWASEVDYKDRITKGAVKGILARIALHAAGHSLRWDLETGGNLGMRQREDTQRIRELYEIARQACLDVMNEEEVQHWLLDDYEKVFKDMHNKIYNKENIFEIGNYGTSANNGVGYYIGMRIASSTSHPYLAGAPQVSIVPTYYLSFDPADKRRDVACANHNITATGAFELVAAHNMTCGKWRKSWQDQQGPENGKTDINWVMLRYSDILLMFAETENELNGPTTDAKEALKKVRKRAFNASVHAEKVDQYVDNLTTKEAFFNAIVKERSWELGTESNIRRTDLIRWNLLAKTIAETKENLSIMTDNYSSAATAVRVNPFTGEVIPKYRIYESRTWAQGNEPTAVPFTESDDNSNLTGDYKALDFFSISSLKSAMERLAREFEENRTELMPLPQELIDASSLLKDAQHPGYK